MTWSRVVTGGHGWSRVGAVRARHKRCMITAWPRFRSAYTEADFAPRPVRHACRVWVRARAAEHNGMAAACSVPGPTASAGRTCTAAAPRAPSGVHRLRMGRGRRPPPPPPGRVPAA